MFPLMINQEQTETY